MRALPQLTLILANIRSLYNVGALMRAADGAGVSRLIACGITPYPSLGAADPRRGPVAARADRELRKTALAAYDRVVVEYSPSATDAIARLRAKGVTVVAVERTPQAVPYWQSPALDAPSLVLVLGHEVEGVDPELLSLVDAVVDIPMLGAGTSLNVAIAAAIVLYEVVRRQTQR
jgi:tRNA G18 (ribose-2'-O)-methylase SpoU